MRRKSEKTVRCPASLGEQETNTGNSQDYSGEACGCMLMDTL